MHAVLGGTSLASCPAGHAGYCTHADVPPPPAVAPVDAQDVAAKVAMTRPAGKSTLAMPWTVPSTPSISSVPDVALPASAVAHAASVNW